MKYVYILKAGEDHYKVGVAKSVKKRLKAIQTGNGNKVYIVATKLCKDAPKVEQAIHRKLNSMSSTGGREWFKLSPQDVVRVCIMLNMEPEVDVYEHSDFNELLSQHNENQKSIESKLKILLNQTVVYDKDDNETLEYTEWTKPAVDISEVPSKPNELYEEVKSYVIKEKRASTSLIQRQFRVGYGRAARILEDLENEGIVGPLVGARPRQILVSERMGMKPSPKRDEDSVLAIQ